MRQVSSARKKLVRRISESAYLFWPPEQGLSSTYRESPGVGSARPTPNATDIKGSCPLERRPVSDDDLPTRVERLWNWPTPAQRDWKGENSSDHLKVAKGRKHNDQLPNFVAHVLQRDWPTPSASVAQDGEGPETWLARREELKKSAQNGNGAGMPLTIQSLLTLQALTTPGVNWPTPSVSMATAADMEQATTAGNGRGRMTYEQARDNPLRLPALSLGHPSGCPTFLQDLTTLKGGKEFFPPTPSLPLPSGRESSTDGNWMTPNAQGGTGYLSGSNRDTWRPTLEGQAEGHRPELHSQMRPKKGKVPRRRLNPIFVTWLMGWPLGWANAERPVASRSYRLWEMESSRLLQHMRLLYWQSLSACTTPRAVSE